MKWLENLVCPDCLEDLNNFVKYLKCTKCGEVYYIVNGIPVFHKPPFNRREYLVETLRYNKIALTPPEEYDGFDNSYPTERAVFLSKRVDKQGRYLNIGQGFGLLEKMLPEVDKYCLDQSIEFLKLCENIPSTKLVCGFAEKMPFKNDYFRTVVSDSVFQTVVDQKEFLIENVRVLEPDGRLLLTVTYKWNYPRKPQDFPVKKPELLMSFLKELGVHSYVRYHKFPSMKPKSLRALKREYIKDALLEDPLDNTDMMVLTGVKE